MNKSIELPFAVLVGLVGQALEQLTKQGFSEKEIMSGVARLYQSPADGFWHIDVGGKREAMT